MPIIPRNWRNLTKNDHFYKDKTPYLRYNLPFAFYHEGGKKIFAATLGKAQTLICKAIEAISLRIFLRKDIEEDETHNKGDADG